MGACFAWACEQTAKPSASDAGLGSDSFYGSDTHVSEDTLIECNGTEPGTFQNQTFRSANGKQRFYWMHVPALYRCNPTALLMDFHGTGTDHPEEAYQTASLIDLSEQENVIVVRPRSNFSSESGTTIYRWDQNPGDIEENIQYAHDLVTFLRSKYNIDAQHTYASGFSTGSNMTAQLMHAPKSPFAGYGIIGGGIWTNNLVPPNHLAGKRIYLSTGYKDYLWPTARTLITLLEQAEISDERLFIRRSVSGHELYAWHWQELWAFLKRGEKANSHAPLTNGWIEEPLPEPNDVLAFTGSNNNLFASGSNGKVWKRENNAWRIELDHAPTAFTALAKGPEHLLVGGEYTVTSYTNGGWTSHRNVPNFDGMFPQAWISTATWRGGTHPAFIAAGYWNAGISFDGGTTWSRFGVESDLGSNAQISNSTAGRDGTVVLVGYHNYIGVSRNGETSAVSVPHPAMVDWWNGVDEGGPGVFWVVGDHGSMLVSSDHGQTWTAVFSGTTEDLYAINVSDSGLGIAVGRKGTVIVTEDAGGTWTPSHIGRDVYLGAAWVHGNTLFAAGENGLVLTHTINR